MAFGFWLRRFNHKTAAEDVHFTSVLSDSESDSEEAEAEAEPTPLGRVDETLEGTPKEAATKWRNKLNASVADSPKPKGAANKRGKSISNGDASPKPKEVIKKRGKLASTAAESPKPKEATKKTAKSAPTAAESPQLKEATKKIAKSALTTAESPKPKETTYKRRGQSVPVAQEKVPTKEGGESDPVVKVEGAEEENVEDSANWEGSSEVLEMIMVKDVAKGSEVGSLHTKP